jgi:hypothetical protein
MQIVCQCPQLEASNGHVLSNLLDAFLEVGGAGSLGHGGALNKSTFGE